MNILIVGNGFDLSHYLPTKYDHFMVAMGAIENWDEQKGEMGFDDIFGSLYEKESYFFKYTKAIYQTDEIKISLDQIKDFFLMPRTRWLPGELGQPSVQRLLSSLKSRSGGSSST